MKKNKNLFVRNISNYFTLLSSTSTLLCCALPAFLSIFVGGMVVSSYISLFPWLIPLSKYKSILFIGTGLLLLINGIILFIKKSCPIDKKKECESATKRSNLIYIVAVIFYTVGILFSFIIPFLMEFSEGD